MFETIVAIATAPMEGAIAIIRLSGEEAITLVDRLFSGDLTHAESHKLLYGQILEEGKPLDEVLVSVARAPHSYTGEDVVEINCHGGLYVTQRIYALCLGEGAKPAGAGEFTRRAFLNGRLDLTQAEAVNDLIRANDSLEATSAVKALKGSIRQLLEPLCVRLMDIMAAIEANIDFPEYEDIRELTQKDLLPQAKQWKTTMEEIIRQSESAGVIKQGIDTVILGKPNVGKSSILNALLEEDKAIVTEIPGTTRDLVEGKLRVGKVTLNLLDTAGIRQTDDPVEKIGIEKSYQALEKAKLVLLVLDASKPLDKDDQHLLDITQNKTRIILSNKTDLATGSLGLPVSAIQKDLKGLIQQLETTFETELQDAQKDTLGNARQIGLAMQAKQNVEKAIQELEKDTPPDLVNEYFQSAYHNLKEILGEESKDDLLDGIFSRFCVGK